MPAPHAVQNATLKSLFRSRQRTWAPVFGKRTWQTTAKGGRLRAALPVRRLPERASKPARTGLEAKLTEAQKGWLERLIEALRHR